MKKSIYSIYGLDKEAAQFIIKKVLAVDPAELEIVKHYYDEPHKAVFFEVSRQDGESLYHMNSRFCRLTGITKFVVNKNYPKWSSVPEASEAPKPQPKRCSFMKFLFGRFF